MSLRINGLFVKWTRFGRQNSIFQRTDRTPGTCIVVNFKSIIFVFLFLGLASLNVWSADKSRVALVIGNDRYEPSVGALRNPGNDAKAVARALRGLGFSVVDRYNLNRDALLRAMDDFRKLLPGAEVAVFYYAGHGISIDGANYLIPIKSGFDPTGADSVSLHMLAETHLFNAEQAIADMTAAGAKCNLAILDACRTTRLAVVKDRGPSSGGTLIEMKPPTGSLIAFATDSGHMALDGDGKNGLYTEELLKNLITPGITIEQVFKRTRSGVIQRSGGAQVPAEYSRLIGDDIYLAGEHSAPPVAAQASPPPARGPTLAEIQKLADAGPASAVECMKALKAMAEYEGAGDYAATPIDTILERVKEDLKNAAKQSPAASTAELACDAVLKALPDCIRPESPRFADLKFKALNRSGDALVLLGRTEDAIAAYDAAMELRPKDAYALLNRGNAYLALDRQAEARADFEAAVKNAADQPKAKKLALHALEQIK